MFIFAQILEKFAQKQNVPKFLKNLPSFQKLPNTCSPAIGTILYVPFGCRRWRSSPRRPAGGVTGEPRCPAPGDDAAPARHPQR